MRPLLATGKIADVWAQFIEETLTLPSRLTLEKASEQECHYPGYPELPLTYMNLGMEARMGTWPQP